MVILRNLEKTLVYVRKSLEIFDRSSAEQNGAHDYEPDTNIRRCFERIKREFKELRWRRQRERDKTQKVNEQNNDSTRVIPLFSTIHFFAVLNKTAT